MLSCLGHFKYLLLACVKVLTVLTHSLPVTGSETNNSWYIFSAIKLFVIPDGAVITHNKTV